MATDAVMGGRWVIIGVAKGTFLVEMEGNALGRQWREWPLVLVRQAWLSGFGVRSPPGAERHRCRRRFRL